MANIKISDLAPAATPLDNDTTLLETTVLEAGEEVSRRINVSDIVAAISGLDATFLTVSNNANLPNERVLTEGTNVSFVDTGPNGTLTINVAGAGFGDVFKVGTPVDNQLGVWTGDGTIEGDPDLTWDGSTLTVDGSIRVVAGVFGPILSDTPATRATPSVIYSAFDPDSGLGGNSVDEVSLIAGGVELLRGVEVPGSRQVRITPGLIDNNPLLPALAFGDGDTGFFEGLDDNFQVSVGGVARFFWELDSFNAVTGTGPAMLNEASSATNPVFTPRRSDPDSGIGQNASNEVSLIGGGVELARAVSAASGGLLANNTLTGGGIERVLTVSDISGGGDVFKVGTPVDNQIGVWTGDGTIEGDPRFIWTGSRFEVFGAGLSNRMRMEHDDTDWNMTAINGGAFIIDGLGDGIDIESNASSPAGNLFFKMHGDGAFSSDFVAGRFVNDDPADAGGALVDIFGQRDTTPGGGNVRILHSGVNHLGTPIISGPTGQVGGIGTVNAATDFSLFTDSIERVRIEGSGEVGIRHGNVLAIYDTTDADSLKWSHDGVDGLLATVGTTNINITGLSGRIMQGAETLAFLSEVTVSDPLLLSSGGVGVPTYSFAADSDTGVYNPAPDSLGLTAGGVLGFSITESGSHVVQTNEEHVGLTASVTQTQVGGLALLSSYNEIATVANSGDALTAFAVAVGQRLVVINNGANDLQLFPASGDDIGAGVDTAITIAAGALGIFLGRTAVVWDTLFNGTPTHPIPTANDAVQARRTTTQTLTAAFVDVTLDVTDVETDAAVLDHDLVTNTDNIIIGVTGTYEIFYQFNIETVTGTNSVVEVQGRVRLNDGGTDIPGSFAENSALRQHGSQMPNHLSCKFIVDLTAADFVTLQVQKIDLSGAEAFFIDETSLQVTRLI